MIEPPPQRHTRRDVLEPEVDRGRCLRESARPEAINEHADAVIIGRRIVDAFHLQRFAILIFLHTMTIARAANGGKLKN